MYGSCLENLLSVEAVDVAVMDVNFAMRSRTVRFWTTSSRVGQMHRACEEHVAALLLAQQVSPAEQQGECHGQHFQSEET